MPQSVFRKWWFWAPVAILVVIIAFILVAGSGEGRVDVTLNQFIEDVRAGRVAKVEVQDTEIRYKLKGSDTTYETDMEEGDTVIGVIRGGGIDQENFPEVEVRDVSFLGNLLGIILQFLPIILVVSVIVWLVRRNARAKR